LSKNEFSAILLRDYQDYYKKLITFVKDRPGHDRRYAINCDKIKQELDWGRQYNFEEGLDATIKWYMNHQDWADIVRSGEYRKWLEKNYKMKLENKILSNNESQNNNLKSINYYS
jgi:dTDP-glucose 4,6-dehydratase